MTTSPVPVHYRSHRDPRSSHQQIIALVREFASKRGFSPVLDVGCAQGMLAQGLSDSNVVFDGVEMNPAWADIARPHYRDVWTSTIEAAPLPRNEYRMVVCGDVLEHVVDPLAVLRQLREASAPDAKFVISLPNVAHLAIRLLLLIGKFPKMERGILDKTHLHFYTRATASQMLREAGLDVERLSVTGVPIDELWKTGEGRLAFRAAVRAQHVLLDILPGLFGYQLIFLASAPEPRR
jgi:2-polyprenyl-3-methyl-5-hydroxy-6-metoxy-1,4-benzoquinol methylase